jgi:hypothetical protein
VKYQAAVTVPEKPAGPQLNAGQLLLNAFLFCLIALGFCILSGLLVGGAMMLLRRSSPVGEEGDMVSLHLSGKFSGRE